MDNMQTKLVVVFFVTTGLAIGCTGHLGATAASGELHDGELVSAGCDPDSFAACSSDTFICVTVDSTSKRCEGQNPAVPDSTGDWQCYIEEDIRVCSGDHIPLNDREGWTCFEAGDGTTRCSAPSYFPSSGAGDGPWDCFYNNEFLLCDSSNTTDLEPDDDNSTITPFPPVDDTESQQEQSEENEEEEETEEEIEEETTPPEEMIEEDVCEWPVEATVESCQYENSWDDHVGHCNSELGTEDRLDICLATNDWMPCDEDEQYAWCTRRVPGMEGPGGPWYEYLRQWVESRHGGDVTATFYEAGTGPLGDFDRGYDYYMVDDSVGCRRYMCTTPLVVSFDSAGVVTIVPDDGLGSFDLSLEQDGRAIRTDWPSASTPWLAIDLDQDGMITSGRELFGSASLVAGLPVSNGFQALAAFDDNADGVIDASDSAFGRLLLWADHDGNRVSTDDELQTIKHAGITALDLAYRSERSCDERGNCGIERASFRFVDSTNQEQTGVVIDVHLAL